MFLLTNFKDALIDAKNYIRLIKIISKHQKSYEWQNLNLKVDWIKRIYTVINMRKEDFGDSESVRQLKINKQLAQPIYTYLTDTLNLSEILVTKIKYIPDTYSYLLYFKMVFKKLSLWYVIKFGIFCYLMNLLYNLFNVSYWINCFIEFLVKNNIIK